MVINSSFPADFRHRLCKYCLTVCILMFISSPVPSGRAVASDSGVSSVSAKQSYQQQLSQPLKIATASSFRLLWPHLISDLQNNQLLKVTFGSSGNLTRQLLQGAPFEVFISANSEYTKKLYTAGVTESSGAVFATGQLAWVARDGSEFADAIKGNMPGIWLAQSLKKLNDDEVDKTPNEKNRFKLAIANPRHAPYGIAAMQVLQSLTLTDDLEGRLLLGENAAQALQFLLSGGAEAALVPVSLVAGNFSSVEHLVTGVVDSHRYAPVQHTVVLKKGASTSAGVFKRFLLGESAADTLVDYGLVQPQ